MNISIQRFSYNLIIRNLISISIGYAFLVTWLTALVMVIVHERVPDSKRYPPLPDIFRNYLLSIILFKF
jgi:hypothetical protein